MIKRHKQRGFTVLELVIYMGLLLVLMMILMGIFNAVLDTSLDSESNAGVQQDGRYLLAKLSYDIRNSTDVLSPALGSSTSTLSLDMNGNTNSYTIQNGVLQITSAGITDNLSGFDENISGFTVQTVGNASGKKLVELQFTLTSKVFSPKGLESASFSTTVGER